MQTEDLENVEDFTDEVLEEDPDFEDLDFDDVPTKEYDPLQLALLRVEAGEWG